MLPAHVEPATELADQVGVHVQILVRVHGNVLPLPQVFVDHPLLVGLLLAADLTQRSTAHHCVLLQPRHVPQARHVGVPVHARVVAGHVVRHLRVPGRNVVRLSCVPHADASVVSGHVIERPGVPHVNARVELAHTIRSIEPSQAKRIALSGVEHVAGVHCPKSKLLHVVDCGLVRQISLLPKSCVVAGHVIDGPGIELTDVVQRPGVEHAKVCAQTNVELTQPGEGRVTQSVHLVARPGVELRDSGLPVGGVLAHLLLREQVLHPHPVGNVADIAREVAHRVLLHLLHAGIAERTTLLHQPVKLRHDVLVEAARHVARGIFNRPLGVRVVEPEVGIGSGRGTFRFRRLTGKVTRTARWTGK